MTPEETKALPWWARMRSATTRALVRAVHGTAGHMTKEEVKRRKLGNVLRGCLYRELVEQDADGNLTLTERGRLVALDQVPLIPEEDRITCACGLTVDRKDEAQVAYLQRHQTGTLRPGEGTVGICPKRHQEETTPDI